MWNFRKVSPGKKAAVQELLIILGNVPSYQLLKALFLYWKWSSPLTKTV